MTMTQPTLQGISPFFIVSNVVRTIGFYRDALGFEARYRAPERDSFFAILARDAVRIFVKAEAGILPAPNSTRHPHMRWDAYVYVPEPDALAAEFAANGVAFRSPLQDTHDGLRGFEIADPDGYVLFFGRTRE
ncbi:Uncharacterized conserved protein PhnB, glyoxalase superfamily [Granulicella rosea]|uniref:Uncharacterized conserved protein PhnB, glyoxalase superfamily n=1 Tax=Granulicella rosea TaxID=474952 RepID=A0A239LCT1_9BACT|nr:VOC family protein [Granulicella rosea]SNT27653.1 Uncharacterized conserved protein PhnB, glyoxalase superfamily [Granulicella rosea]